MNTKLFNLIDQNSFKHNAFTIHLKKSIRKLKSLECFKGSY